MQAHCLPDATETQGAWGGSRQVATSQHSPPVLGGPQRARRLTSPGGSSLNPLPAQWVGSCSGCRKSSVHGQALVCVGPWRGSLWGSAPSPPPRRNDTHSSCSHPAPTQQAIPGICAGLSGAPAAEKQRTRRWVGRTTKVPSVGRFRAHCPFKSASLPGCQHLWFPRRVTWEGLSGEQQLEFPAKRG